MNIIFRRFLVLFLTLVLYNIDTSLAGNTLLNQICSNTSYASQSSYETTLTLLLSSLNATAVKSVTKFFNTSIVGNDTNGNSYTIYGLYLCRGDDSNLDCQKCVPLAIQGISQQCPTRPLNATIWYVDCMVRYSNNPIFNIRDSSEPIFMINEHNKTVDDNRFDDQVSTLMRNLATDAATSTKRYATNIANFVDDFTVYAEAQCTPDLSVNDCQRCLIKANNCFPSCCRHRLGARVLSPSCNVRYDIEPFFQNATTPPSPLPWTTPSNGSYSPPLPILPITPGKRTLSLITIVIVALIIIVVVQVCVCIYLMWRRGRNRLEEAELLHQYRNQVTHLPSFDHGRKRGLVRSITSHTLKDPSDVDNGDFVNVESLQYDLMLLQIATNNFSNDNKLGEGGFGGVYKGILPNGKEIAVKRLSVCSSQGVEQFKNEVEFVAKLQHRNLVRLLGFCLAGYEKLLVFEYVPNKSLDFILFDPRRREELNWETRYKIISGIARGMLYLHEDSRLRIVHRDLKASNILLDAELNPKISDFGTARHFDIDESQANTSKIAGTFGYMAPEYLLNGEFSLKSDVYSFGVLILEIISGRKSTSFGQSRTGEHLLSYAWKHWSNGNPLEIVDPCLRDLYNKNEVIRCIQIGFLCVQGDANQRPTMAFIVLSLNSDVDLPMPQQPGLFICTQNITQLESNESTSKSIQLSFASDTSAN